MGLGDNNLVIFSNVPGEVPSPSEMAKNGRIGINQADGLLFTRTALGGVRSTPLDELDDVAAQLLAFSAALAVKADAATVTTALAGKASTADLAAKADAAAMTTALAGKAAVSHTHPLADVQATVWTGYTPTLSAGTGTLTSASAVGRYMQLASKTIFVVIEITITTNGTAAIDLRATIPFASRAGTFQMLAGRANSLSGKALSGAIPSNLSLVAIRNSADNTYPGANGEIITMSGLYEAA